MLPPIVDTPDFLAFVMLPVIALFAGCLFVLKIFIISKIIRPK